MEQDSLCAWEFSDTDVPMYLWPYATACGKEFMLFEDDETLAEGGYNFCPNCGRRIVFLLFNLEKESEKWTVERNWKSY